MALNNLRHSDTSGLCILVVLLASYERGEPPCTTEVQYALYDTDVRSHTEKIVQFTLSVAFESSYMQNTDNFCVRTALLIRP